MGCLQFVLLLLGGWLEGLGTMVDGLVGKTMGIATTALFQDASKDIAMRVGLDMGMDVVPSPLCCTGEGRVLMEGMVVDPLHNPTILIPIPIPIIVIGMGRVEGSSFAPKKSAESSSVGLALARVAEVVGLAGSTGGSSRRLSPHLRGEGGVGGGKEASPCCLDEGFEWRVDLVLDHILACHTHVAIGLFPIHNAEEQNSHHNQHHDFYHGEAGVPTVQCASYIILHVCQACQHQCLMSDHE